MEKLVLIVHVLAALSIVGLILLQQGKGASMGASFGSGASQTVFGSAGGGHFLVKVTGVIALVFFITSFSLAVLAKRRSAPVDEITLPGFEQDIPAVEQPVDTPAQSDVPVVDEPAEATLDVPVMVEEPEVEEEDVQEVPAPEAEQ